MAKAVLAPIQRTATSRIGRRVFRKQVLPLTTIDYTGEDGKTRKITFDKEYLRDLADSFRKGAYSQVPFFFADGENRHNEAPDNYRGVVKGFDLTDDGLDMIVETTKAGAKVIKDNPELGVSARIIEGVSRADGKQFPRAVRHVLGTLFPKVPSEGAWAAVDLAEDADISEVVDLTAIDYEEEGSEMPKTATKRRGRRGQIGLSSLSDEQFETLLDLAEAATLEADDLDEDVDEDDEDTEDDDEPKARKKKSKVKVTKTTERTSENSAGDDDEDDADDEDAADDDDEDDEDTSLSDRPARRVRESDADRRIRTVEANLAAEAFRRDKQDWVREGVPPFLVDLAEPVLAMPQPQVVDLSDGKTADARTILREMLDGVKGIIDLSAEMGSSIDASDLDAEEDPDKALMDEWDKTYS